MVMSNANGKDNLLAAGTPKPKSELLPVSRSVLPYVPKAKDYDPKNYGPIWEVLKFPFIPKHMNAGNISERVKLWLLFS